MIGPGIRGIKLPIIPTKHRIMPTMTKNISINSHKITKYKSEFFVNSTFMRLFICITVLFLFVGCDRSISKSKIIISNDQISWKNNDEFPSINYCDQFKLNSERFNCFKNKLSDIVKKNFGFNLTKGQNKILAEKSRMPLKNCNFGFLDSLILFLK